MATDPKTEFRLTQLEQRLATLSDRIHKLGNDALEFKLKIQDSNSFIDWREWRTQVFIWATLGILGGIIVTIVFYAREHL